jgi:hypothetical protein
MADPAKQLAAKFAESNRYANFGPVIRMIRIQGFRGIDDLTIGFDSPICALSGLNGAGKSTVGQLAICAYKKPSTAVSYSRYYIKDFFPVSVADPAPFTVDGRVEYTYETNVAGTPQTGTVSRATQEWSGYKRQPEGYAYYVGFTLYIPKIERRDLSIYRGSAAELRGERVIPPEVKARVSQILNQPYDELRFQVVGHGTREIELGHARRFGRSYSENNMGFGEGRVMYMVDLLENAPEQSLFVLEEPETSLHEDAQYRLAKYLLDACNRRHHQIIMSTHSSIMLDAFPSESRKLLFRDASGVTEYAGISATRARAILSGGQQRALTVCVEDEFAKVVLTELLRRADASLLKTMSIHAVGDKKAVAEAVKLLKKLDAVVLGVRDGDTGPAPQHGLYSLPGAEPPEKEVFGCGAVRTYVSDRYNVSVDKIIALDPELDHHKLPDAVAAEAEIALVALNTEVIRVYVEDLDPAVYAELVAALRSLA